MANEKRLIDLDRVLKPYEAAVLLDPYEYIPPLMVVKDLESQPLVDAVEVVRCKDCEYRHDSCFAGNGNTYCDFHHKYFPLDGFCSYGERRTQ